MRIIDPKVNREKNKTLKQYELSMWEKLSFTSLAIVTRLEPNRVDVRLIPSLAYNEYDMKKGFSKTKTPNKVVKCLLSEGLVLNKDDIVLVVFTDLDISEAVREIESGKNVDEEFHTTNTDYHNSNYGIIISKVII